MEAPFTYKSWGLLWLLRSVLGYSRAKRSPTGAGGSFDCYLGCEISPRCNRVVQVPYFYDVSNSFGHDRDSMRLIRADASRHETMRKRIELHGSSFYPQGLGLMIIAAEDARLIPRKAQSYKGWGLL